MTVLSRSNKTTDDSAVFVFAPVFEFTSDADPTLARCRRREEWTMDMPNRTANDCSSGFAADRAYVKRFLMISR